MTRRTFGRTPGVPESDLACVREAGSGNRHLGSHLPTGRVEAQDHWGDAEYLVADQLSSGRSYGHGFSATSLLLQLTPVSDCVTVQESTGGQLCALEWR